MRHAAALTSSLPTSRLIDEEFAAETRALISATYRYGNFGFRDLPLEVQIKIFNLLWVGPESQYSRAWGRQDPVTKLISLNKSFYNDFAPLWYQHAIFTYKTPQALIMKTIKVATVLCLQNIRHLSFWYDQERRGWDGVVSSSDDLSDTMVMVLEMLCGPSSRTWTR